MKSFRFCALAILAVFFSSCPNPTDTTRDDTTPPDTGILVPVVYAAGYSTTGSNTVAGYWRDGAWTALSDGTSNAKVNDMALVGSSVYAAGYLEDSGSAQAGYWANGVWNKTTNSGATSYATSIALYNGDVYTCGYSKTVIQYACFWKNGGLLYTEQGAGNIESSIIYSMAIESGFIVYGGYDISTNSLAGEWDYDLNAPSSATNFSFRQLVSGANDQGTTQGVNSVVRAMATVDTGSSIELYRAGYCNNSSAIRVAGYWQGEIWKNETWHGLSDGTTNAEIESIVIDGSDVYAGGYQSGSIYLIAGYWKNGSWTALSDGTTDAEVRSLVLDDGDVYAGGYLSTIPGKKVAGYWKNGTWTALGDGSADSVVTSLAVAHVLSAE